MAQQEDGWPLGLQPLNVRIGLVRNGDVNGSVSFNTLLTGSPTSSTDSSSDLDTESTGSFFHDKSITLGNLIGISSILELSRRSTRRTTSQSSRNKNNIHKPKTWLFSICSKLTTDAVAINKNAAPSLRHFLEAEKRAATTFRRNNNQSPNAYGPDDFSRILPVSESNTLFIDGHVAPGGQSDTNTGLFEDGSNGYGAPLLLSCLCPHPTH